MLTEEDDVEIHPLARRGWSQVAIAQHTGRDRKTVRKYLKCESPPASQRRAALSQHASTWRRASPTTPTSTARGFTASSLGWGSSAAT
jgi:transposase